jgi:hypothetical protein
VSGYQMRSDNIAAALEVPHIYVDIIRATSAKQWSDATSVAMGQSKDVGAGA